ncbi:MAG TPA: phospho-N-acetylmuramoyl-pentapeptide-transferase [Bellilinea sp.]|nr:phospho-N-acetylmuramoyl-pentapeptide-transferase [Bellilinea sp.]
MSSTALAISLSILSFMLAVIWGPTLLRILKYYHVGKLIRTELQERYIAKMGTPTMGGVMIILPVALITLILNGASLIGMPVLGRSVILPLLVMLGFGLLGAIDDWEGIRGPRKGLGMRARTKFLFQVILAVVAAWALRYMLDVPQMYLPGTMDPIDLGPFYIPIAAFIIVAMSNAVNFTDGLDGLAGLISATAFAAFALVGATFGFLWFNVHPAQLIMGDIGALALGAVLGTIALMTGQWLLLPIIAVIPVAEALSVVLQVGYFKWTKGKRIFRMSPLHYHFELGGWSETQVVQRFWLIGLLCALLGVALALVRS